MDRAALHRKGVHNLSYAATLYVFRENSLRQTPSLVLHLPLATFNSENRRHDITSWRLLVGNGEVMIWAARRMNASGFRGMGISVLN